MKIGLSTYSLNADIRSGKKTVLDAMRFAKEHGAEHIELVPSGYRIYDSEANAYNEPLIEQICALSQELSLPLSNYAISANLIDDDAEARRAEVERVKRHVDAVHRLGISFMRHDLASAGSPNGDLSSAAFEHYFANAVASAQEIADYAAQYGITTLLENHGRFINGADRVLRVVEAVDRPNYGLLLDTGNFRCVDEDPLVAVKKCAPFAKMVHLKDFYVRKTERMQGLDQYGSWFSTASGEYRLRGSILGQGDLNVRASLKWIRESGYNGYVSIEYEGVEDCELGCIAGMQAARNILANE